MNLDDQLRAVLNEEAGMRTATRPDVQGLIRGGQARRRRRNAVWAGSAFLAAVIAAGGYGVAQLGDSDTGSVDITNQPTPRPLPETAESVSIEPGTYAVSASEGDVVAPYTVTVPTGWRASYGDTLAKNEDQPEAIAIDSFVLSSIRLTDDACTGPEHLGAAQTSAAGLVAGLRAQGSGPRVSDPVATTVGGLPATRIDLDYPGSQALSNCRLAAEVPGSEQGVLQIWSGYFVLFPTESASAYVVEVGGRAQVFLTRIRDGASAADRAALQSILDSISFQTGAE